MLILVGVTVTVAINGGLFEKSKEAAKGTEIGREKEELTSAIATAYDVETGVIKKDDLNKALNGWTVDGEEGGPYTVKSPKQNTYKVAVDGTITEKKQYLREQNLQQYTVMMKTAQKKHTYIKETM